MTRKWLYFLCLFASIEYSATDIQSQEKIFHIVQNDTTEYDLVLKFNSEGYPSHYYRDLFTPVCKTGECLPVSIILKWDLLGNYLGFEVPDDEPLTKEDHIPFEDVDYQKLHSIFSNKNSLLEDFELEVLKKQGGESIEDIDGVTGATPKNIANSSVDGAFYTCYTLWHHIYDHSPGEILRITDTLIDKPLLSYLIDHSNYKYQHYAIEKLAHLDMYGQRQLISKIGKGNVFVNQHILQAMPIEVFKTVEMRNELLLKYEDLHHSNRELLIHLVGEIKLTSEEIIGWGRRAARENAELSLMMLESIAKSSASKDLKEKEYIDFLSSDSRPKTEKIDLFLQINAGDNKLLKKLLK